ncbi:3'-5' exonuclease [Methylolobus aquaticus]
MRDILIDIETMGTGPNAAIASIGAVAFDLGSLELTENFYCVLDLQADIRAGGEVDGNTIGFWLGQPDAARLAITEDFVLPTHPGEALLNFRMFVTKAVPGAIDNVRVWGNGAAFDNVVLRQCYRRHHLPEPWQYWNDRCYRTIASAFPDIQKNPFGTKHHAGDDAIAEAKHLLDIFRAHPELRSAAEAA